MKAFSHARAFIKRLFNRKPAPTSGYRRIASDPVDASHPNSVTISSTKHADPRVKVVNILQRHKHTKHRGYCRGAFGSPRYLNPKRLRAG